MRGFGFLSFAVLSTSLLAPPAWAQKQTSCYSMDRRAAA